MYTMKSIVHYSVVTFFLAMTSSSSSGGVVAFVHQPKTITRSSYSSPSSSSLPMSRGRVVITPEIEAAIVDVRAAAAEFGEETAYFANAWIDKTIEGKGDTTAAGLLDECVLDDGDGDKCERFEKSLAKLVDLLGIGVGEQY
ncbi:hypothetical protein ACHAXA_004172 [Cyclostephanos tholiformis]|uniref:Pectinesterase inhibitor domain-containing protein n=1 Tax=Cyclostephanos tholiformis TaxID=382380 RepID=A0ABD3RFQ5_9STRA